MTLTSGFRNAISTRFDSVTTGYRYNTDWWFNYNNSASISTDYGAKKISFTANDKTFAGCFTYPDDEYGSSEIAKINAGINNAFKYCVSSYVGVQATFDVSYSMTYGEDTYDSGTIAVNCNFNYESLKVDVTNVTLSSSNIIF